MHDKNDEAYHNYTLGSIWNIDGGLTVAWSYLDSCMLPKNKRGESEVSKIHKNYVEITSEKLRIIGRIERNPTIPCSSYSSSKICA